MLPTGLFFRRMIDFHTRFAIFLRAMSRLPLHLVRCWLALGLRGRGWSAGSRLLSGHYIAGPFVPARRGFTRGQKHADTDNFLTPKGTTKITLTGRRALAPHALHCRLQRSLNQPTQPHRRAGALRHRSTQTPPMDPPKDPLKDPLLLAKDPRSATKDLSGLRSRGKDGGGSVAGAKERNPC